MKRLYSIIEKDYPNACWYEEWDDRELVIKKSQAAYDEEREGDDKEVILVTECFTKADDYIGETRETITLVGKF